jgi:glycerophosphoryl diester phosphodiesterase
VVNSERSLARMFRWGVEGVFTDVPAVAAAMRSAP